MQGREYALCPRDGVPTIDGRFGAEARLIIDFSSMAWNQPGQNNPWGRRPGGQGNGPDLDERVKSWQRRLESLFRPGGGRGGEGRSLLDLVAVVALALWLGQRHLPDQGGRAGRHPALRQARGHPRPGAGWRWPWPIETLIKVNVASVQSSEYKSRVLTSDVNLVDLRFAVQYQLSDPKKVLFQVKDPEATLSEVSEMAIREVVGRSQLDDVLVGKTRPEITRPRQGAHPAHARIPTTPASPSPR